MVIAEACASGKTVVLFDRPPMSETASPECRRARPFDIDDYARHMVAMIRTDESDLLDYSRDCRHWAGRFRWDNLALQQENFYLQAVER